MSETGTRTSISYDDAVDQFLNYLKELSSPIILSELSERRSEVRGCAGREYAQAGTTPRSGASSDDRCEMAMVNREHRARLASGNDSFFSQAAARK